MLGTVQAPSVYLFIQFYPEALESGDSHSRFQLRKLRHGGVVEPRFKSSRWLGTPSLNLGPHSCMQQALSVLVGLEHRLLRTQLWHFPLQGPPVRAGRRAEAPLKVRSKAGVNREASHGLHLCLLPRPWDGEGGLPEAARPPGHLYTLVPIVPAPARPLWVFELDTRGPEGKV